MNWLDSPAYAAAATATIEPLLLPGASRQRSELTELGASRRSEALSVARRLQLL